MIFIQIFFPQLYVKRLHIHTHTHLVGIQQSTLSDPLLSLLHRFGHSKDVFQVLHGSSILGMPHILFAALIQFLAELWHSHQAALHLSQAVMATCLSVSFQISSTITLLHKKQIIVILQNLGTPNLSYHHPLSPSKPLPPPPSTLKHSISRFSLHHSWAADDRWYSSVHLLQYFMLLINCLFPHNFFLTPPLNLCLTESSLSLLFESTTIYDCKPFCTLIPQFGKQCFKSHNNCIFLIIQSCSFVPPSPITKRSCLSNTPVSLIFSKCQ